MFSKTLFVFTVVCFLSISALFLGGQRGKKFFREDYTYIEAVESFYKLHTTSQTWFDAEPVCAQEGASLFYPENENEAHTVMSFFKNNLGESYIFVGSSDLLAPGVYKNIDGKLVSELYVNWNTDEPNNVNGHQNCIVTSHNQKMFVVGCELKRPFICKKKLQWNYSCQMFDFDYNFNSDTGNCYKLHTTPLNWTDAYAACHAERSYLAVVNNQLEADYLANLTKSTSYQRVGGNYYRGIYHLGFHNRLHRGWQTVKGTPMNAECDAWWDHHEPMTDDHNQCGSMFFNGRLNTIRCDTESFFICEHEVDNSNSIEETSTQLSDSN